MRLFDYIEQGGAVMYVLLFANIVGFAILLWKFFVIFSAKRNIVGLAQEIKENTRDFKENNNITVWTQMLKDEVHIKVHSMEAGMMTIKIIASVAPLLGLLGTVIGIFMSFQVISSQGLANPSDFAGGISLALLTTVAGLIVAIPHFIGYNYLVGLLDEIEIVLEKQLMKDLFEKKDV